MFPRVDESLATQDPSLVDQRSIGELRHLEAEAEIPGKDVREGAQVLLANEAPMLVFFAVAREDHVQPIALRLAQGAQHRDQAVANRADRGEKEEERGPPVFAPCADLYVAAGQGRELKFGCRVADVEAASHHEGSGGSNAFVEDTYLAREGEDDPAEGQHQHPEKDVREEEGIHQRTPAAALARS